MADFQAAMSELPWVWYGLCALLGGLAASFAGVAAWRLSAEVAADSRYAVSAEASTSEADRTEADTAARRKSSLWRRSECEGCGRKLNALDLLPVLGWLLRRGQCPACGHRVNPIYPIAEAAGALLFVAVGWWWGAGWTAVFVMCFTALLMAAAWTDFSSFWIPDRFLLPLLFLGLLASPFEPSATARVWGAFLPAAFMLCAMGLGTLRYGSDVIAMGDVYLIMAGGATLGVDATFALLLISGLVFPLYAIPVRRMGGLHGAAHDAMRGRFGDAGVPWGPGIALAILLCMAFPSFQRVPLAEILGL